MWIWLIISAIVRVFLVALELGIYSTMIIRNKHGFTDDNPPARYIAAFVIVGTLLYIFQFILPA